MEKFGLPLILENKRKDDFFIIFHFYYIYIQPLWWKQQIPFSHFLHRDWIFHIRKDWNKILQLLKNLLLLRINLVFKEPSIQFHWIGGWNAGSGSYSHMASDPEKRKTFIDSVSEFLDTYHFEGVDLDWVSACFILFNLKAV